MRFSLVLATVGRTEELNRFFASLDYATHRNFEVILVDQNPDDRLNSVLDHYDGRFPALHLRSERGLSRARNVGLRRVTGDVVAFPDDDCWYPPNLLNQVEILVLLYILLIPQSENSLLRCVIEIYLVQI